MLLHHQVETPATTATATAQCHPTATTTTDESMMYMDDYDIDSSACSTPYVSAPSSPGRSSGGGATTGFYYSAPASPMHFMVSASTMNKKSTSELSPTSSFEFDFSASKPSKNGSSSGGSMSSADELFLNGQIRPMKLSSHLQRPQNLAPLLDIDEAPDDEPEDTSRGRDHKMRDRSLRRRTRSMSPLRTTPDFGWHGDFEAGENSEERNAAAEKEECGGGEEGKTTPCESGASSRSSSVGRSSSRWVFLKEFLYRSKSEGRNNGHKFWGFSPVKDRKMKMERFMPAKFSSERKTGAAESSDKVEAAAPEPAPAKKKAVNGVGKRRVPRSPHELHYTANRAQAEELRRKTFLPYRQGLLGCLGFSSKSYGAMNGFARALNPVSSR